MSAVHLCNSIVVVVTREDRIHANLGAYFRERVVIGLAHVREGEDRIDVMLRP